MVFLGKGKAIIRPTVSVELLRIGRIVSNLFKTHKNNYYLLILL